MNPNDALAGLHGAADNFRIQPLSLAHDITLTYLDRNPFIPIFGYGIVNPYGPSLQSILVVRDGTAAPLTVVSALLHPFAPKFKLVGHLTPAAPGERKFEEDLLHLLDHAELHFGSAATFLLRSRILSLDQTLLVAIQMLARRDDLAKRLSLIQRFPRDPWNRINLEMGNDVGTAGAKDLLPNPSSAEETAAELANALLSEGNFDEELKAFVYAWNGSIKFQEQGGQRKSPRHTPFDRVRPIVEALALAHLRAVDSEVRRRFADD